jgi:MFS family permease
MPNPTPSPLRAAAPGAGFAMVVLTSMNLLNYIDRYVASAVKELFRVDLGFTDTQTSIPFWAFTVVYMLASPVFSSLADRWPRKVLIAAGVAFWSLATASAALATGFLTFLLARSLIGVGEAAYATISPALISDYYPPDRRNRMLTIFYVAIPVGAALAYAIGGPVGQAYGWRAAFLIVGLPGLVAAAVVLLIREPVRGGFDRASETIRATWREALPRLRRIAPYVVAVAGYVAVTFASGALAEWAPAFLTRFRGVTTAQAGLITGAGVGLGSLLGTLSGGLLADRLRGRTRSPYFALSGISMGLAALAVAVALSVHGAIAIGLAIFAAQFFMWFYNGPINTIIVNAVPFELRARAVGLSILMIHMFGDAISPVIVGRISESTGNLGNGMVLIPIMMLVGAVVWIYGWRRSGVSDQ